MATPVYLPKIGMTMEEGVLTQWVAAEGAEVKRGDILFEMETEKVQMEVEAEADGLLHQLVPDDTKLKPGDIVGALLEPGEAMPASMQPTGAAMTASSSSTAASVVPATAGPAGDRILATPIARRLAAENGIDLGALAGSGPGGRIVEADVRAAIDAESSAPVATAPSDAAIGIAPVTPGPSIPYAGRRRTIGERLQASLRDSAQLTLVSETPLDEAMSMLHGLNREWRREGVAVTLTALVIRAAALALREHPRFNSRIEGDAIVTPPEINVGLAVDLEDGLIVPVIRDAASRPLKELAQRVRQVMEAAKDAKLGVDDITGGTFTVTSLEGSGVDAFTPVINPPQAAILGVGRVREVAAFEGSNVVKRQVTTLSLTFDHRIADGGPAARFLDRISELLGRPYMLM
jgi:pyruvate/2-oxoglutarate dehydrogenase complex dihydrolipoamide acyltransferase (E2) component